jgi:uncharacterized protein YjiS (DUF1127 family)
MSTHSVSSRTNGFLPSQTARSRERLIEVVRRWQHRLRSRGELSTLSDYDLKDLGYPPQAESEKHKPFWQE